MTIYLLWAFLLSLVLVILAEVTARHFFPLGGNGRRPRPTVAVGMLASLAVFWLAGPHFDAPATGPRAILSWAVAGALVMFIVGLRSDYARPRSRDHFIGTMVAALLAFMGGFTFIAFQLPWVGRLEPGLLLSLVLTLLWVFIVVSMVELCSLLPLAAGIVTFLIGATVLLPFESWRSPTGFILCGILMGAAVGRFAGKLIVVRSDPHEKADILVMGYVAACAVLATFLKSVAVTAFILPIGFLATLFVLIGLQGFDRQTLLRERPRGE